ncbi:YopX family protein [Streptococcus uberis]|uniref:YopX family protein n=1 Tax=Streptococcus uberis TaxID=1349 RepID=UPI001FF399B3|nr:YopX family protein [Streptococcus uberis]MCK1226255.1 YopX family protein [Streptococcus uberis]
MIPKFRVWDSVKKAMHDVQAIVYTEERVYPIYSKLIRKYIPFGEAILMQYTGLKDKNGVEIFEGDIVIAWSQGVKGTFEIKRRIDGLWLLYPAWKDGRFWYLSPTEDCRESIEVIGNVWEDGDLIDCKDAEAD